MKKRFLGIVCILYSCMIIYVWVFDKLKNFLAPQMQMYIKLSLIPIFIIGIIMLFSNKACYKFKFSDLVLLLPLLFLIGAGDGRLTTSFANNRAESFNNTSGTKTVDSNSEDETKDEIEEEVNDQDSQGNNDMNIVDKDSDLDEGPQYDFTSVDYEIEDESYYMLSNIIPFTSKPDQFVGKTIRVRGFVLLKEEMFPKGTFGIGKYMFSCCAADAGFGGFIAKYDDMSAIKDNKWYEVEGVLEKIRDTYNNDTIIINIKNLTAIDGSKEELYAYPCYSYGDEACSIIDKYNIEY